MDYRHEIEELEKAAHNVLAPPNLVTQEQRHAAEKVFLAFRKSQMPYRLCRHILDHCNNDYVLFQAAATIKESVVREWTQLAGQDVELLRSYLLHYVTSNIHLQGYVREQILQAVAVIFKRASLDCSVIDKESLFNDVSQLVASGDISLQLIACSILTSLLNEFSSTTKTSSVGLTWEFHRKCKMAFEQKDLKRVFSFCLEVLYELEKAPSPPTREMIALFNRILAIMEQVLCWEFMPKKLPPRLIGSFISNQSASFKPPSSWRDLVLNEQLLQMMFTIHKKVRFNSEMAHHSLQCLAQLATLNGPVLNDDKTRCQYLNNFIRPFVELTSRPFQDYEALGIANTISNLLVFFPTETFLQLEKQLLDIFVENLTSLTCQFGQAAAVEEMQRDDTLHQEAYKKLLDSWLTMVTSTCTLPLDSIRPSAHRIFNSYLQCHLASPDGTRNQGVDDDIAGDEEYDEIEEDDRERFQDELASVGALGRLVPEQSVSLLVRLLEDKTSTLQSHLQRLSHQTNVRDSKYTTAINAVNEDLHWLLLISANTLTENVQGETPMIPSSIMKLCINETEKINIDTTLKVLASPGVKIQDIPGAEQKTDPVVRLVASVFRLCEIENSALNANLADFLSPQVGSSMMWFLKRWAESYLLPNEEHYSELSCALTSAFGQDSEAGMWTVGFIIDKVVHNLHHWSSEVQLVNDTLELLLAMVNKRQRTACVVKCPQFWKLAEQTAANAAPYYVLPSSSKRLLSRALVLAGSNTCNGKTTNNEEYWQLILQSVNGRFNQILNRSDLKHKLSCETTKEEVISIFETLIGIVEGTLCTNTKVIFKLLYPVMKGTVHLLELYKNFEDVVVLILELFKEAAGHILQYLGQNDSSKLYDCCLQIVQIYAKDQIGRKTNSSYEEEEQYEDLCLLLEMLNNLSTKEFIDFGVDDDETSSAEHVNGASLVVNVEDVILYALNSIVPIMTADLLKFPALCTYYVRMLTYLAESHPEKVCALPEDLLKNILITVEYCLTSLGADIMKLCLEFVSHICTDLCVRSIHEGLMYESMAHFLKIIFNMLILDTFEMELCDTACHTFFALICSHKEHYKSLVNGLMQEQPKHYQRLAEAFNHLTPADMEMTITRPNRLKFMNNFEKFLAEIRGFLCIR